MVLHLAEQLDVPLRDRNQLLLAAGYAPAYGERAARRARARARARRRSTSCCAGHEPYPAVVVDRGWNIVAANASVALLTEGVAPELLEPPANVLRISLHPDGMAPRIANLGEWRAHLLDRLGRQVAAHRRPGPARAPRRGQRLSRARRAERADARPRRHRRPPAPARRASASSRFFSTVATFGTAVDITVAELSIESFFPADAATAQALRSYAP